MLEAGYTYSEYKNELAKAIKNDDTEKMSYLYHLDITWYRDVLRELRIM